MTARSVRLELALRASAARAARALRRTRSRDGPTHVLFCMADHYEPGTAGVAPDVERDRVRELVERFPAIAEGHRDASGRLPSRTWFFPPHYHRQGSLRRLVALCERGYGEVELHLHHGKDRPDTAENLRATLERCVEEYGRFGIFGVEDGRRRYGFIHGDWALANSRGGRFCGVDGELDVLRDTGCYADFTFPSLNEANPRQINSIHYARHGARRPHDRGPRVRVGRGGSDALMIVQGPLFPLRAGRGPFGLWVYGDVVNGHPPVTPERVDAWVRTGICVRGRPDWVVVKAHTHGATDGNAVLGAEMEAIWTHLETRYNDGSEYLLHYVTARELYNVCRAAEAGEPGSDPSAHRDYRVEPPRYDASPEIEAASPALRELVGRTYSG